MKACNVRSAGAADLMGNDLAAPIPAGKGRVRKERSDCKVTEDELYDSIVAHFGILTYVAIAVGITRPALYKRIDRAPRLQAARDGARRVVVDVATYHLRRALHVGTAWAVQFAMCRMDGIPLFSMTPPQPPQEPREPGATREPRAEPPEAGSPQPERARKTMLRLIHAVERAEPWAVKYCLRHLEPAVRYMTTPGGTGVETPRTEIVPDQPPRLCEQRAEALARASYGQLVGRPLHGRGKTPAPAASTHPEIPAEASAPSDSVNHKGDQKQTAGPSHPMLEETKSVPPAVPDAPACGANFAPTLSPAESTPGMPAAPHLPPAPGPHLNTAPSVACTSSQSTKRQPSVAGRQDKSHTADRKRKRRARAASRKRGRRKARLNRR